MTTTELSALLQSMGVPADAYSIGADHDESYCVLLEAGRWKVYYSERGQRTNEFVFADEGAACQRLLDELLRDHIVRSRIEQQRRRGEMLG